MNFEDAIRDSEENLKTMRAIAELDKSAHAIHRFLSWMQSQDSEGLDVKNALTISTQLLGEIGAAIVGARKLIAGE